MPLNLTQKIIKAHLVEGELSPGSDISIKIDQTLTQDATGTMVYLELEALDIDRVKTEVSVSYVDHNMIQADFKNPDDHRFLQSAAEKYGIYFSRPGNGICHQVHLERFAIPGKTLIGSDSHTPTAGGMGTLAIGAGGLDVALAMAGVPFHLKMPKVVRVRLFGKLPPFVSAKDVILELLRRLSVKGGVGKVMEYTGEGVATLTVPERATITNMGAELGATTSIFPSDENTYKFLKAQHRERDFVPLSPDPDATYDEEIILDLSTLTPMVAKPHMPDNVVPVSELEGMKVDQIAVGSCTNSSFRDLYVFASILKGKKVAKNVSVALNPGSRQAFIALSKTGLLDELIASGVRVLEFGCGPCIGMGFAPPSGGISLRTYNRNFKGRSGTPDAKLYLVSPEVAAASALFGVLTDPRKLGISPIDIPEVEEFPVNDDMIVPPAITSEEVELIKGPNISYVPIPEPLGDRLEGEVLLKVGDNITTDHIMPAGAEVLPYRSNIPKISEYVFTRIDPEFPKRAKEKGGGFVVGGENYGQGSSREHAAIAPMYLGIRAVIVKSFSRIHKANLINFGILPLEFSDPIFYDKIDQGDELVIEIKDLKDDILLKNITKNESTVLKCDIGEKEMEIIKKGGALAYWREKIREGV